MASAGADAGSAAVVEDDVTQLGARADPSAVRPAVEDQPAADAGPERQQDEVGRSAARSELPLGDRSGVAVVVDPDRKPEPFGHPVAEIDVGERNMDRGDRPT
jgi:hypothetical protein